MDVLDKDRQTTNKELASIILISLLILGLSMYMLSSYKQMKAKDTACYNVHVIECEDCHNSNKTYLLCSGFCANVLPDDNNYGCLRISPKKNCSEMVPKVCLT